jgi:hypothetical protein
MDAACFLPESNRRCLSLRHIPAGALQSVLLIGDIRLTIYRSSCSLPMRWSIVETLMVTYGGVSEDR